MTAPLAGKARDTAARRAAAAVERISDMADDVLANLVEVAQAELKRRRERKFADRLAAVLGLDEPARTSGDEAGGTT